MDVFSTETTHETGGYIKGVAIALVTQNDDPEKMCRVKVSFPWHEQPRESYWARLSTPMAGKDRGFVTIPEVGDEVLVAFEREDLRFPTFSWALERSGYAPISNDDGNRQANLQIRDGHYHALRRQLFRGRGDIDPQERAPYRIHAERLGCRGREGEQYRGR